MGGLPIAELDASGNIISRFVYGEEEYVPSYMVKNGINYKIITDHLGSPVKVINSLTGVVVQEIFYDAWGNVISDTSPGLQPFGFSGGLYDNDSKLIKFGHRDYSAETSRWTTRDPIEFKSGDYNLYLYAMNDPINIYDPTGLTKKDKWYGFDDKDFKDYVHKEKQNSNEGRRRDTNYDKDEMRRLHEQWEAEGKPGREKKKKKGGGKWGKRIYSKIPGLNILFLLDSLNEGGPEQAFNDATWPVSEIWSNSDEQ